MRPILENPNEQKQKNTSMPKVLAYRNSRKMLERMIISIKKPILPCISQIQQK